MTNRQREDRLRAGSTSYYNTGSTLMTDEEYDTMKRQHEAARQAEPNDPVWEDTILDQVGAPPPAGFAKVKRTVPMLSLTNVFEVNGNCDGLRSWVQNLPFGTVYVLEPKIDGVSLELRYESGQLVQALTRGDGLVGSDVTANIRNSGAVPVSYPCDSRGEVLVVRGEIAISHENFAAINKTGRFANPRNAASGAVMSHDQADAVERRLTFLAHSHVEAPARLDSQSVFLEWLSQIGFTVAPYCYPVGPYLKLKDLALEGFEFPVDGMVAKVNRFDIRRELGETSSAPRWAVAIKFPQEQQLTRLNGITIQVGRSGVLTPVAELEPVHIDGSVVSRASLHNEDFVRNLHLEVGDTVLVQKAAAIIPEIVESHTHKQNPNRVLHGWNLVGHLGGRCPACGCTDLNSVITETCTKWYCTNPSCVSTLASAITYWASRQCFEVDGLGGEAATALAQLYVDTISGNNHLDRIHATFGLFKYQAELFANLQWTTESGSRMTFGNARAAKVRKSMDTAINKPLNVWITAAGIHTVGVNTGKELSRLFRDSASLIADADSSDGLLATLADSGDKKLIAAKFGVDVSHHLGPVSADAMLHFVKDGKAAVWSMYMPGGNVLSDNYHGDTVKVEGSLTGMTVCITGTLSVTRPVFQKLLEAAGATVVGSVSSKTKILVAGADAGSKLEKARKAGVTVLTEEEARGLL